MLLTTQFPYRKGLGTCDALLCVSHKLQSALESGQEARIVQIYFSTAFDRFNHLGILYKLCSVGIEGYAVVVVVVVVVVIGRPLGPCPAERWRTTVCAHLNCSRHR